MNECSSSSSYMRYLKCGGWKSKRPGLAVLAETVTITYGLKNPTMAAASLYLAKPCSTPKIPFPSNSRVSSSCGIGIGTVKPKAGLSHFLSIVESASASASSSSLLQLPLQLQLHEPSNALSLPTWAVHVSSVLEWILAMALVWQYGEKSGYEAWKGLSWGMVPLLGGALCACTWHFFYNSESLEVLVALQAALTVIGNATMCIAAYRIYKSSRESSENL